jgi:hypothetical protein
MKVSRYPVHDRPVRIDKFCSGCTNWPGESDTETVKIDNLITVVVDLMELVRIVVAAGLGLEACVVDLLENKTTLF